MAVIAILGCAGVGKSTLVKQLSAYLRIPALFEGDKGVFPVAVMENLSNHKLIARERWFIEQYTENLRIAHKISKATGVDVLVDAGSHLTIEAYAVADGEQLDELAEELERLRQVVADRTVILTADAQKILELIIKRDREGENADFVAKKALVVQGYLQQQALAQGHFVLDRTSLDFHNPEDIIQIAKRVGNEKVLSGR
jgi:deoxyadenosine/deoxycytidine kinase